MTIKTFHKLSSELANKVKEFELENFYTEKEKTPERLAEQKEKKKEESVVNPKKQFLSPKKPCGKKDNKPFDDRIRIFEDKPGEDKK